MKYFPEYFVGVQNRREGWDYSAWLENRQAAEITVPLGFATPYEDNAAGRKREETVRSWAKIRTYGNTKDVLEEPIFTKFPNDPIEGFVVLKSVSRYSTSNVFFRIMDPRGFELEISSPNLMDIINKSEIDKGLVKGKMVWLRDGAQNYLVHEDDERYLKAIAPKPSAASIQPGTWVKKDGTVMFYVGRMYATFIEGHIHTGQRIRIPGKSGGMYDYHWGYEASTYSGSSEEDPKLWSVYQIAQSEHYLNGLNNSEYWRKAHGKVHLARTPIKDVVPCDPPQTQFNLVGEREWTEFSSYNSGYNQLVSLSFDKKNRIEIPPADEIIHLTGVRK